ncbi:MAG: protein pelota [archaeon GW2011_AR9]|nr:MAG: protein pelota [archaeon GW2011_AR9]MBS3120159.1 mRNA surveillance protein pelota [Candidatus Woesearchaeota archaeon]HIG92588.1 mRNA surveillance protein pelota [Candidatus Woesearchaeota archaeon]HIH12238.1 mRNA surveillance protein pelota [Candidatus Woesearchaeota archaeon]
MYLVHRDFKKRTVTIRVTDLEDLWYLSHIIDVGDLVRGKTTRKIRIGDGENAKVAKKTLTLTIEAETIEIDSTATCLRINGKVKEAPEDVPRESYHALSLEMDSEFTLEKVQWLAYQKQKLEEAASGRETYLLCLFDREEALFALAKKSGYEVLANLQGDVTKKGDFGTAKTDFQQEIIKAINEYALRYNPSTIIIASPAFYKEDLFKKITNPQLKAKIVLAVCSAIDKSALDEVMKRPELAAVLKSSRLRREKIVVDELLSAISKDQLAVYGWKEVQRAIAAGAVSKLLLTDHYFQQRRAEQSYAELDQGMKKVDELQGEIHLLSSEEETGKKVDGLGGIAALLRYKLEW